ncbi:MAG: histidine kinase, partial [Bacteroidetes bacterium]|nr:histidine kinase [Bacteroidota bacterium]
SYNQFGVNNGLPSSECYSTTQDAIGFVWIFTDRGACRFNGYDFKVFTTANGLPNNVVFDGKCDKNGTLWVVTHGGKFAQFNGYSFVPASFNQTLLKQATELNIDQFVIDENNVLWAFANQAARKSFYLVEYNITKQNLKLHTAADFESFPLVIKHFRNGQMLSKHNPTATLNFNEKPNENDGFGYLNGNELGFDNKDRNRVPSDRSKAIELNNHFSLVSYGSNLISVIDGRKKTQNLGSSILNFFKSNDTLMIGTLNKGVLLYSIGDTAITFMQQWLPNKSATSIIKDQRNALWITTLNDGLIHIPNLKIASLSTGFTSEFVSHVKTRNNVLLSLYNNKELLYFYKSNTNIIPHHIALDNYASCLAVLGNNKVVVPNATNLLFVDFEKHEQKKIESTSAYSFAESTTTGWMAARKLRYEEFIGSTEESARVINNKIAPSCLYFDSLQNLKLIGTYNGVYQVLNDSIAKWCEHLPFADKRITDITRINDGTLAIGTLGDGIYFVNNELIEKHLNVAKGLKSNLVNDALMINENMLAIASNSGIEIIKTTEPGLAHIRYSIKNGLKNNQVNELCIWNNYLVAATANGITLIDLKLNFSNNTAPAIFIDSMLVNGSTNFYTNSNSFTFKENGSGIAFHYTALDYGQNGQIQYAYKLLPNDQNWTLTENRNVKYAGLTYGDYKFQLSSINPSNGMVYGLNTLTIPFSVTRPFYLKTWFIVACIVGVSALIVLVSLLYVRYVRTKANTAQQLNEMEQQALKAHMNPHFLFNALNSVQNFIAINDKKESFSFISRFSTLVREFLDNSQKNQASLKNELDGLKAYLELEKLRFENKFDYHIYVAENLKPDLRDIQIPGMIIQPILENAVIHGVRPLNGQGHIKIDVISDSQNCIISVSDNGIGRKASATLNATKVTYHKSFGMANIKRRIDLLNKYSNKKISFDVIDIEEGNETGTVVILRFPLNRVYHEN